MLHTIRQRSGSHAPMHLGHVEPSFFKVWLEGSGTLIAADPLLNVSLVGPAETKVNGIVSLVGPAETTVNGIVFNRHSRAGQGTGRLSCM